MGSHDSDKRVGDHSSMLLVSVSTTALFLPFAALSRSVQFRPNRIRSFLPSPPRRPHPRTHPTPSLSSSNDPPVSPAGERRPRPRRAAAVILPSSSTHRCTAPPRLATDGPGARSALHLRLRPVPHHPGCLKHQAPRREDDAAPRRALPVGPPRRREPAVLRDRSPAPSCGLRLLPAGGLPFRGLLGRLSRRHLCVREWRGGRGAGDEEVLLVRIR